ncbi:HesB/YadR/YfhF family protein [Neobacillus sp. K501]
MKIQISHDAVAWYKQELNLNKGDYVRFFARYGGCSTVQSGFSLGVSNEEPTDVGTKVQEDGITFYIEEKDLWYFDDHNLIIDYQTKYEEPVISYEK